MRRVLVIADEKSDTSTTYGHSPDCSGLWLKELHPECNLQNDYQFFINDYSKEVDYVVVRGCAIKKEMEFQLPKTNVILLTSEPYSVFEYPQRFRDQFGLICSCQDNMKGDNVLHTPPMLDWFAGISFVDDKEEVSLTYHDFKQYIIKKDKLISIITSDKLYSKGHYDRLKFVKQLKKHFGNSIDVYGRGINNFQDKWDVIAPYKYHIVIENSKSDNYFTEKITDAFLGMSFPIYYGCSNLESFFPDDSFAEIDIHNFEQSVRIIKNCITSDYFEKYYSSVERSRQLTLERYNIFNMMAEILDTIPLPSDRKSTKTIIRPCNKFTLHNLRLGLFDRNIYKINKILTRV